MSRALSLSACIALLALSGCISTGDDPPVDPAGDETPVATPPPPLPEAIDVEMMIVGATDPFNFAMMGICSTPLAQCQTYPFTLAGPAAVEISLTWTVPVHDFDLYLFSGETQLLVSGNTPPGDAEGLATELGAGEYTIVVVPWLSVADTFHLVASFADA